MSKSEKTSSRVGTTASKVLSNPNAGAAAKSLAGSALAQTGTNKQTSPAVATKAAKALDDGRSSGTTRTLAGSTLTQKTKK